MSDDASIGDRRKPERIDLYLSGGGYRAALAAVGVLLFLQHDGRWPAVRRIVSVSGGSIVNAHLAIRRPDDAGLTSALVDMFVRLTSRTLTVRLLITAAAPFLVAWIAIGWLTAHHSRTAMIVAVLAAVTVSLSYLLRCWAHLLFRDIVGSARLDDSGGTDWTVEHIFSTTDLSNHGSAFFIANPIQPQFCSLRRRYVDGRDVRFTTVLRATTALPPLLPPPRVRIKRKPGARNSPIAGRPYLWDSECGTDLTAWLADGGVTGNLGVQLDSTFSADNVALLEFSMAKTLAGHPHTGKYFCPRHGNQLAWHCCACRSETYVVDASGLSPRPSRLLNATLGVPGAGFVVYLLRSLHVMYESSLIDDQANVGDALVGVVRTEQMVKRVARKNWPLSDSPESAVRMMTAGASIEKMAQLATPAFQRPLGMSDLMMACHIARAAAAEVRTGLFGIRGPVAARVVASAYLNVCLNIHGPMAFAMADQGIRHLGQVLGPAGRLDEWWAGVTEQIARQ
jgi:predicted acylesterase/phospholipase RssA